MVKIKRSSDELNRFLSRVYVSPKYAASFSGLDKLYRMAKNQFPSVTRKEIQKWAEHNLSYSLHKPSRRTFKRNKAYAPEIDSLWEADLAFVQDVAKENDGVNYLLVVIDVLSKYVWVRAMKNKTARSLLEAFDSILSEGRKPEKLRMDKGTEFVNDSFQQYLKKKGIQFYTANNEPKASVVERVNRTLKSKLYRYFTAVNSLRYIDVLQDLVDSYNNTYHRSIGRAPATVSLLNVGTVRRKLYGGITSTVAKKFKFHVGDHVRLSLRKRLFKKGYKMNWTEEIFQITKRLSRTPVVYTVQDLLQRPIEGTFYEEELQRVKRPDIFRIEKVLKKRTKNKNAEYLVRWSGYGPDFDSWIQSTDIEPISKNERK